jgi:transposase
MPQERSAGKSTTRRYSSEEKQAAVRMVRALRAETGMTHGAVRRVAEQLGYGIESVRTWVKQADVDDGARPGVTSSESTRVKDLEQEVRELRRANEILKRAAVFFGPSSTASSAGSRVHRGQQGRRGRRAPARSRAHLQGAAGGSEHVLRRPPPAAVAAR